MKLCPASNAHSGELICAPSGLGGSTYRVPLSIAQASSPFDWLHLVPSASSSLYPTFLSFLTSWNLHWNWVHLHNFMNSPLRNSIHGIQTHCMLPATVTFLNLSAQVWTSMPSTVTCHMTTKLAPHLATHRSLTTPLKCFSKDFVENASCCLIHCKRIRNNSGAGVLHMS